jgi:hypothetical protein
MRKARESSRDDSLDISRLAHFVFGYTLVYYLQEHKVTQEISDLCFSQVILISRTCLSEVVFQRSASHLALAIKALIQQERNKIVLEILLYSAKQWSITSQVSRCSINRSGWLTSTYHVPQL